MAKKPAVAESDAGSDVGKVLKLLSDNSVEYVDLRFTDPRGKWQHTAQHVSTMDEDAFRVFRLNNGIYGQRQGGTNQMVRVLSLIHI